MTATTWARRSRMSSESARWESRQYPQAPDRASWTGHAHADFGGV